MERGAETKFVNTYVNINEGGETKFVNTYVNIKEGGPVKSDRIVSVEALEEKEKEIMARDQQQEEDIINKPKLNFRFRVL